MPAKMFIKTCYSVLIIFALAGCGGTTHYLASGNFSQNSNYEINSYYGCCGCEAKYFTISSAKQKIEQVIYSYNCHHIGLPTKFIFKYNDSKNLIGCDALVATTRDDYTLILNEQERQLFTEVATSDLLKPNHTAVNLY
jgi:hypothetical protein